MPPSKNRLSDDCLVGNPDADRHRRSGARRSDRRSARIRRCDRGPARHPSGPGNRPGGTRRHDVHRRHHGPPEGGGGQPHGALRLGGQHRPRTPGHGSGRRRRGDPHVPRRGTDDLVPGLDPGRELRRDLPQVGPGGVHRGNRAPPHLIGVPGAGPGPRPAPLARLRSGAAGFAQKHRGGWRADASGVDRGMPGSPAALRLHRSLRAIRDRTADDPQTPGHGGARRHRRPAGGGSGPPDRGPGRKPGPARHHRRGGGARPVPDGGLLRGRGGNRPLFPRRLGMDGGSREIRRGGLHHAWSGDPGRSSSRAVSTFTPPRSRPRSRATRQSKDCTVFGVPDERWGEAPVAYVVRSKRRSPRTT